MEEPLLENKKRPLITRLLRIVMWLFAGVILIAGSLVALLFVYEKEVKAAIVAELNKHLKAEVKIEPGNIDLTILKTFPDCSIEFRDVLMLEALPVKKRDTLVFAERLNLHFNVKDLWNKNYTIQKIKLTGGTAKLIISKKGKPNYIFWDNTPDGSSDSIRFNLQLISIKNFRFSYHDKQSEFRSGLKINDLDFKGNFKNSEYELSSRGDIKIGIIASGKSSFFKEKDLIYTAGLDVKDNKYHIRKTEFSLNRLAVSLSGNFIYKDSISDLNLEYNAPGVDIASLLSLLPEEYKNKMNEYSNDGNFYTSGSLIYKNKNRYKLTGKFGVRSGTITYKPNGTTVNSVNLEGILDYSNSASEVRLENFSLAMNNDRVKGNAHIKNFKDPFIQLNALASVDLLNLQNFWPIDTLTSLKGKLVINTAIEGLLSELKNNTFSTNVKLDMDASVTDLEARFKKDVKLYSVENVSITARNREVEVKDLKIKRGSSDLTLNGKIPGLFNYLLDRKSTLSISGNLNSKHLSLDDFIPEMGNGPANNNPLIPANVRFSLDAVISKFTLGKFTATNITGDIEILNQKAIVTDMKLETMEGDAKISAFADNSKNRLDLVLQGSFTGININQLFIQLNNFGQSTLEDKNIKGYASAEVDFSGSWSNALISDPSTIVSSCKINIDRGELIDFKPLLSLARFVEVKELQRIKFSTLKSEIKISNSTILIPKTTLKNSALNIDLWGTHTFNNNIDYHFSLLLSELIAKKRTKKDDEFGPVEDDKENRRRAFILMTGTVDNPIIKYDKQGMKEKVKEDLREEKQNIKSILKEEFGVFKKDSLKKRSAAETEFELEKQAPQPKKTLELKKKEEDDDF